MERFRRLLMVLVIVNQNHLYKLGVQSHGTEDEQFYKDEKETFNCSLDDPALKVNHANQDLQLRKEGVVIQCLPGYASPFGGPDVPVACQGSAWESVPWEDPAHPACVPECPEGCGQGLCVAPGECECFGRSCEEVTGSCNHSSFNPRNSVLEKARNNEIVLVCKEGFKLTTNTPSTPLLCHRGQWLYADVGREEGIFCLPVTTPPCQNGGRAVEGNKCACDNGFDGPRCQYRMCDRDPPKVKFAFYEDVKTDIFVNASNENRDNPTASDTSDVRDLNSPASDNILDSISGTDDPNGRSKRNIDKRHCEEAKVQKPSNENRIYVFSKDPGPSAIVGKVYDIGVLGGGRAAPDTRNVDVTTEPVDISSESTSTFYGSDINTGIYDTANITDDNVTDIETRSEDVPDTEEEIYDFGIGIPDTTDSTTTMENNGTESMDKMPVTAFPTSGIPEERSADTTESYDTQVEIADSSTTETTPLCTEGTATELMSDDKAEEERRKRLISLKYLVCAPGYKVKGTGTARLLVMCRNGEWHFPNTSLSFEEISCVPVCSVEEGGRGGEGDVGERGREGEGGEEEGEKGREEEGSGEGERGREEEGCKEGGHRGRGDGNGRTEERGRGERGGMTGDREEACLNGGTCILPDVCACKEGHAGKRCEKTVCDGDLPDITNAYFHRILSEDASAEDRILARCAVGFEFKDKTTEQELTCQGGSWRISEDKGSECHPTCREECIPPLQCVGWDRCGRPRDFVGPGCDAVRGGGCVRALPDVNHGKIQRTDSVTKVICDKGYKMRNNKTEALITCEHGFWLASGLPHSETVIDCLPHCEPECLAEQECVAPGICKCLLGFKGPNCQDIDFVGGPCPLALPPVDNAIVSPSGEVECLRGFTFPSGETKAHLFCARGQWIMPSERKGCLPRCALECQNGGTCVAPNMCECPEGYEGQQCQVTTCGAQPEVQNAILCNKAAGLTITCTSGYKLTTGSMSVVLHCNDGSWVLQGQDEAPECVPQCWHECKNGGKCVAPNVCQCQGGYWGKYCEHRKCVHPPEISSAIFINKLSHATISCPPGYKFLNGEATYEGITCRERDGFWTIPREYQMARYIAPHPSTKNASRYGSVACVFSCDPGCENGGTCVGENVCLCPEGFRGETCDGRKCDASVPHVKNAVYYQEGINEGRVECLPGYKFPNNETAAAFQCHEGSQWIFNDLVLTPTSCEPICQEECHNGGSCVAPEQCLCPKGFSGRSCEVDDLGECQELPRIPRASMNRDQEPPGMLTAQCQEGYAMSSGVKEVPLVCQQGTWSSPAPTHPKDLTEGCMPVCNVTCYNGGRCEEPNTCVCSEIFRGNSCRELVLGTCSAVVDIDGVEVSWNETAVTFWCENDLELAQNTNEVTVWCEEGLWALPFGWTWKLGCRKSGQRPCSSPVPPRFAVIEQDATGTYAVCPKGFLINNETSSVDLECQGGEWQADVNSQSVPVRNLACILAFCEGNCTGSCLHGGYLYGGNCVCPEGYSGDLCQVKECGRRSLDVRGPARTQFITASEGVAYCLPGYRLSSGKTSVGFVCLDGAWRFLDDFTGHSSVECLPECQDPCSNTGTCVAPNTCRCRHGFSGSACWNCKKDNHVITTTGHLCVFPFEFQGRRRYDCVRDSEDDLPWCATNTTGDHRVTSTGICLLDFGYKKVTVTASGQVCVFPFRYAGRLHYACAERRNGTFCATSTDVRKNILTQDFCISVKDEFFPAESLFAPFDKEGHRKIIKTLNGSDCILPFIHGNKTYHTCVYEEGKRPYCASAVDDEGKLLKSTVCTPHSSAIITLQGKACIFPFKYKGKMYHGCTADDSFKLWCATSVDPGRKALDFGDCTDNWAFEYELPKPWDFNEEKCESDGE